MAEAVKAEAVDIDELSANILNLCEQMPEVTNRVYVYFRC